MKSFLTVGEMGVDKMGIGEMGVGEMGVGKMGTSLPQCLFPKGFSREYYKIY